MTSRAKIGNGRWRRKVTWNRRGGIWRTDMFKTVLRDDRLQEAAFICKDGPTVFVPAEELRRVLPMCHDHYFESQIWGPFNIDTKRKEIDGHPVSMHIE